MKKAVIFYSSANTSLQKMAIHIAEELLIPKQDLHDVSELTPGLVEKYHLLLFGIPTSATNEIPEEWIKALNILKKMKLVSKSIALFGCGSSNSCSASFCHTLQLIHNELQATGASFIKSGPGTECNIETAEEVDPDRLVGLAVDEMNEGAVTDKKVEQWVNIINNNRNNNQL